MIVSDQMLEKMATCSSEPIRKWLREKCRSPDSRYSPARFHLLCCSETFSSQKCSFLQEFKEAVLQGY